MAVEFADPATWLLGVVLPLVKPDGTLLPPLGLLVAGQGPTVFEVNVSDATADHLRSCPRLRYGSFAELAGDGWRVD